MGGRISRIVSNRFVSSNSSSAASDVGSVSGQSGDGNAGDTSPNSNNIEGTNRSRITDRHHYYEYLIKSGLKELSAHQMVDEDLDIDLDYSSIIRLVGECEDENSWSKIIEIMVDILPADDPDSTLFIGNILDCIALPSSEIVSRLNEKLIILAKKQLSSKGTIINNNNIFYVWTMLATNLAGRQSIQLMTEDVLSILIDSLAESSQPSAQIAAIICLEQFAITGENKQRMLRSQNLLNTLNQVLRPPLDNENQGNQQSSSANNIALKDSVASSSLLREQVSFCAEWFLNCVLLPQSSDTIPTNTTSVSTGVVDVDSSNNKNNNENDKNGVVCFFDSLHSAERLKVSKNGLEIRNDSPLFLSFRASRGVRSAVWYYEVELLTDNVMQIGWATDRCHFQPEDGGGVGDDNHSIAFDGRRELLWLQSPVHIDNNNHGKWKAGDIVGILLDLINGEFAASINGRVVASTAININQYLDMVSGARRFYPAATLTERQHVRLNFGSRPFAHLPTDRQVWNLNSDFSVAVSENSSSATDGIIINDTFDPHSVAILRKAIRNPRLAVESSQDSVLTSSTFSLHNNHNNSIPKCFICYNRRGVVTLLPCNHDGVCVKCSKRLEKCPVCRRLVTERRKLDDKQQSSALPVPEISRNSSDNHTDTK